MYKTATISVLFHLHLAEFHYGSIGSVFFCTLPLSHAGHQEHCSLNLFQAKMGGVIGASSIITQRTKYLKSICSTGRTPKKRLCNIFIGQMDNGNFLKLLAIIFLSLYFELSSVNLNNISYITRI